jgi:D-glycero-D-manno-heptose 1,7-bisphosphate phosphatase
MQGALFLDRDGIINRMVLYEGGWDSPQDPQDVVLVDDIEKVISWANKKGIVVIEISNQPGVAKGKMDQKTSDAIEERIHRLLGDGGAFIDKVYICPHHPQALVPGLKAVCNCRKPKPGLLIKAAEDLKIDLGISVFLGDKASDVEAGRNAGCKTIIFIHTQDDDDKLEEAKRAKADYRLFEIKEAIPILEKILKSA